jgi:hypothetical protein
MKGLWCIANIALLISFTTSDSSNINFVIASEGVKGDDFYQELKEILINSDRFRMYSKLVDCMVKKLRLKNPLSISTNLFNPVKVITKDRLSSKVR